VSNVDAVELMLEYCYRKEYTPIEPFASYTGMERAEEHFTQHYHVTRLAEEFNVEGLYNYALPKLHKLVQEMMRMPRVPNDVYDRMNFLVHIVDTSYKGRGCIVRGKALVVDSDAVDGTAVKDVPAVVCEAVATVWAGASELGDDRQDEKMVIRRSVKKLCMMWPWFASDLVAWMAEKGVELKL